MNIQKCFKDFFNSTMFAFICVLLFVGALFTSMHFIVDAPSLNAKYVVYNPKDQIVTGTIKNNGWKECNYVSLKVKVYDKDNNLIDYKIESTDDLQKNETWKFKCYINDSDAAVLDHVETSIDTF